MFDRKVLVVALLSFATMFAIRVIFRESTAPAQHAVALNQGESAVATSSHAYKLPTQQDLLQPANREVLFVEQAPTEEQVLHVTLPHYHVEFTNYGGTIRSLRYPKHTDRNDEPLEVIQPVDSARNTPFLLALDQDTPYVFALDAQQEVEEGVMVTYRARTDDWDITKTFLVHNDSYRIDVTLGFAARADQPAAITPRFFVPVPGMQGLERDKFHGVISNTERSGLQQTSGNAAVEQAWIMPTLFGSENSYFAHILLDDSRVFAQRGYFRAQNDMTAILEGPVLTESVSFPLSFYVGPKSLDALQGVDTRLEGLLSFGWLSIFAKMLFKVLQFFYDYIGNYGLAIILMVILLKLLLMPLSIRGAYYTNKMHQLGPRMSAIRKKFANDKVRQHEETMALFRQHGIPPSAQVMGCLLSIPQIPFLFAIYRVLGSSVELYHAPFIGWITDLTVKDPYYVLPILTGALMMQTMKNTPMGPGNSQAKLMQIMMPVVMTAVFCGFPAGMMLAVLTNFAMSVFEGQLRTLIYGK